jgi:hypothetical protein
MKAKYMEHAVKREMEHSLNKLKTQDRKGCLDHVSNRQWYGLE